MPTTEGNSPEHRPAGFPSDGTIVTATTFVGQVAFDDGVRAQAVTGPLETRWVDVFDYLQVVVGGQIVDLGSVKRIPAGDEPRVVRAVTTLEIIDARTVRDQDGYDHDVLASTNALPWVQQTCPQMPHEYAHKRRSDPLAYAVVERMLKASNPESYRAYFRGYQSPNRYWDAPDDRRYWMTKFMINRCASDSVEPPRRVDEGAKAAAGWDGPAWAPSGAGLYERGKGRTWWPTAAALADGYQPCRACVRKAPAIPADKNYVENMREAV